MEDSKIDRYVMGTGMGTRWQAMPVNGQKEDAEGAEGAENESNDEEEMSDMSKRIKSAIKRVN